MLAAPRHRDGADRRHDADVLRARRRRAEARPRHRRARRATSSATSGSTFKAVAGTGKDKVTFDRVPIDRATQYAAEDSDLALRLWSVLKARLPASHVTRVYERLERPMIPVLAKMERARHQGRPADPLAAFRQLRAEGGGGRSGDLRARRPGIQHRLDQAARRHPLRQDGARRRQEDQDRAMVDRREGARRARRRRRADRAKDRRLAAADEAEVDLHRRAPRLHPSGDGPRPHRLRARLDLDRAALVVGAEPAEHPGPHRGGPRHPPRLHRRGGLQARLRRLSARSSFACSRTSPTSRSS